MSEFDDAESERQTALRVAVARMLTTPQQKPNKAAAIAAANLPHARPPGSCVDPRGPSGKLRKRVGTKARRRDLLSVCVAAQGNLCALCGHPFTDGNPATLDHIKALAVGGDHSRQNLQAAHAPCNVMKGRMSMWSFRRAVANGRIRLPDPPEPEDNAEPTSS